MDDADGVTSVIMAQILSPADPDNLRVAFNMVLDGIITKADGIIIDWGTIEFASQRAISDITGQELIYVVAGVRVLGAGES